MNVINNVKGGFRYGTTWEKDGFSERRAKRQTG